MKDSGMSDSGFYRFQKNMQKKMKKFNTDLQKEVDKEALAARFSMNTKPVKHKKTLWERIKVYFYVN